MRLPDLVAGLGAADARAPRDRALAAAKFLCDFAQTLLVDKTAADHEALVVRIREASESRGGEVGISAWNGFAMARFCAQDAAKLRADMIAVLGRAGGPALPRLWLN